MPHPLKLADELDTFDGDETLYRRAFREFFEREMDHRVAQYRDGTRTFKEFWQAAAAADLIATKLPASLGGMGASDVLGVAAAYEMGGSLGYADIGGTLATDVTTALIEHLPPQVAVEIGRRVLAGAIQCMAMTEPEAGSFLDGIRTTAARDGDEYVLNGSKCFITMGDCAEIIYVLARTDPAKGLRGMSIFAVDAQTAGIAQRRMSMIGLPVAGLGEIQLTNVRVPAARMVGQEGSAVALLGNILAVDRTAMAAEALGQAELAFALAVDFARSRAIGPAERLIDAQHTRMLLAEMVTDLRAMAALFRHNVQRIRSGDITATDGAVCKNFAADASGRVVDRALQLHGASGLSEEFAISRIYTSNRKFKILAGTTELLQLSIARDLVPR